MSLCAAAGPSELTESCKINGSIVYGAPEKDAAEELKLPPEQTTGTDFPIVKEGVNRGAVPFTINEGVRTCYHGITG